MLKVRAGDVATDMEGNCNVWRSGLIDVGAFLVLVLFLLATWSAGRRYVERVKHMGLDRFVDCGDEPQGARAVLRGRYYGLHRLAAANAGVSRGGRHRAVGQADVVRDVLDQPSPRADRQRVAAGIPTGPRAIRPSPPGWIGA